MTVTMAHASWKPNWMKREVRARRVRDGAESMQTRSVVYSHWPKLPRRAGQKLGHAVTMLEFEIWGVVQVLVMAISRALSCVWVAEVGLEDKTSGVERARVLQVRV